MKPSFTVRDFMSTEVATLSPDMSLREAIATDFVRAVAEGLP